MPYDFWVAYAPGQTNVADPISRLLSQNKITVYQHGAEEYVQLAAISATPAALAKRKVEEAPTVDEELKVLREAIKTRRCEKCKAYAPAAGELCVIGQLVLGGTCFVSCGFLGHCYQTSLLMTLLPDNTRTAFES